MLSLKFVNRTCGTIGIELCGETSRLLELNSWSTLGGAVYLEIVMVYRI